MTDYAEADQIAAQARLHAYCYRMLGSAHDADGALQETLLAEDTRFSMPPLPAWFSGRADVERFMVRMWAASPWRLIPARANGQLLEAEKELTRRGDELSRRRQQLPWVR